MLGVSRLNRRNFWLLLLRSNGSVEGLCACLYIIFPESWGMADLGSRPVLWRHGSWSLLFLLSVTYYIAWKIISGMQEVEIWAPGFL